MNKLSLARMQLPEKYKENFDVSSEGPSSEVTSQEDHWLVTPDKGPSLKTSKFSAIYFSGSCIPTNESLFKILIKLC